MKANPEHHQIIPLPYHQLIHLQILSDNALEATKHERMETNQYNQPQCPMENPIRLSFQ